MVLSSTVHFPGRGPHASLPQKQKAGVYPGVQPTARVERGLKTYLFVLGGAFVDGAVVSGVPPWLQPVNMVPITSPNSAIRVNVLFMSVNVYQNRWLDKYYFVVPHPPNTAT